LTEKQTSTFAQSFGPLGPADTAPVSDATNIFNGNRLQALGRQRMWNSACKRHPKVVSIEEYPREFMTSKNKKAFWISSFSLAFLVFVFTPARASERLCDGSFEDCRAPLVTLIQNENVQIDIAFWFMDDYL